MFCIAAVREFQVASTGRKRETGKIWLLKPATRWMPQFAWFACAKRAQGAGFRTAGRYHAQSILTATALSEN